MLSLQKGYFFLHLAIFFQLWTWSTNIGFVASQNFFSGSPLLYKTEARDLETLLWKSKKLIFMCCSFVSMSAKMKNFQDDIH